MCLVLQHRHEGKASKGVYMMMLQSHTSCDQRVNGEERIGQFGGSVFWSSMLWELDGVRGLGWGKQIVP